MPVGMSPEDAQRFINYLNQLMIKSYPKLKHWSEEASFNDPGGKVGEEPGWYFDSAKEYGRLHDPNFSATGGTPEPALLDWAQEAKVNPDDWPHWAAKIKQVWRPMEWAQNIAGDVGNRVNAESGLGDLAARGIGAARAQYGDPNDPIVQYLRYIQGQRVTD